MTATTKGRSVEKTVKDMTQRTWGSKTMGSVIECSVKRNETYSKPRALEPCFGSQFSRAERFDKDPIDVRAVPGAYEEVVANFANASSTSSRRGGAARRATGACRARRRPSSSPARSRPARSLSVLFLSSSS